MYLCPENFPTYQGHEPETADAVDATSDWISLENATGCLITVMQWYAADTDLVLTVHEGATGTGAAAIATVFPIWANTDTASTDAAVNTMVRQTDAVTYTMDTTAGKDQICQMYIAADILTAGYSWIQLDSSGGNAGNYVSVLYQLDGFRFKQETPPNALGL